MSDLPGTGAPADADADRSGRIRAEVVEALFELLQEQGSLPSVAEVAERSGVSTSTVFRYFDDLDGLRAAVAERYFTRFAPLFELPGLGEGTTAERIDALVGARVALYGPIAPLARMARARTGEHEPFAATLAVTRQRFADQVRAHLPEADDDVAAVVDVLTSFESWDLLRARDLDDGDVARIWTTGLTAILR